MKDIIALIMALGGLVGTGGIAGVIKLTSNRSSKELKSQFDLINKRIDRIESIQIEQSKSTKKTLLMSLLTEWDKAVSSIDLSNENSIILKNLIEEKLMYEYRKYSEAPINGNSWVKKEFKRRNLL